MPTYEYECPNGHGFEKIQKITDKAGARCPVCGKGATRKISGGAGLVFKGSGFYITDYGKDGKGPRKPVTESGGTGDAKADKPEAKKESKDTTAPTGETKPAKPAKSGE
jgi:putative FmdB family regulatory protein